MSTSTAAFLERAVLRDDVAERELNERGYTVIDLLSPDEVQQLVDFYVSHASRGDLNPEGAYNDTFAEFTTMNSREDFRSLAFDEVTRVAVPRVAEHVIDFRPLVVNYVNKPPGKGLVPVHQNMSVVDERTSRSISVWIALCDCHVGNGTLQFVDASHLTFRGTRGTWAYQEFSEIDHDVLEPYLSPLGISAGQAIVLDDAVIHYSPPNGSDEPRLAIQLVMAPAEETTIYFEVVDEVEDRVRIDALEVEPSYFFRFWQGVGVRDDGVRVLRSFEMPRVRYDARTFLDRVATETLSAAPTTDPAAAEPDTERVAVEAPPRARWWQRRRSRQAQR